MQGMKAISIPFRFDGFGNVATSTDPQRVWAGRVKSVMGTAVGQRVMRPDFGSALPSNLFSVSTSTSGYIESSVRGAAAAWLPDIDIVRVLVDRNEEDFDVSVEVEYRIPASVLEDGTQTVRIV
jgi:phage baseplate assembly protein W